LRTGRSKPAIQINKVIVSNVALILPRGHPPPTNFDHWRHRFAERTMIQFDFVVTECKICAKGKTIERWSRKATGLNAQQKRMAAELPVQGRHCVK